MNENKEKVTKEVREIITVLVAIQSRLEAVQSLTQFSGPLIDAEQHVKNAVRHLQLQTR